MFPFLMFLSATTPLLIKAPCPVINPVKNVNLTAYAAGDWYEIARYPAKFEGDGDCVVAKIKNENGKTMFNITDVTNHKFASISGYMELAKDAKDTGAINLFSTNFKESDGDTMLPVYFLDIDYNNYYIAYKCIYDKATNTRREYAWIASRTKTVAPATMAKIKDFLKNVDQNSHPIYEKNLMWISFTDDTCKIVN